MQRFNALSRNGKIGVGCLGLIVVSVAFTLCNTALVRVGLVAPTATPTPQPTATITPTLGPTDTPLPTRVPPTDVPPTADTSITLEKFNQLKTGMSYEEAVAILGSEGTVSSENDIAGFHTIMYTWTNPGFMAGNMNAMFQNGALVQKAQFGLK